jgi:hypothetical protein
VNLMTLSTLPDIDLYHRHPGQLFFVLLATLMLLLSSPNGFAETYDACIKKYMGKSYTPEKAHSKCEYCLNTLPSPAAGKKKAEAKKQQNSHRNRD